ncbi:hypothetical protein A2U01_0036301 [Trifolium medium]|uniref:Uncharacterized protein n=1 Tax=Trifolium medium TaxID=97028 RepID=A0A392PW57_9FABA|nr:hypothetical protein [Trifolium medium]
MVEARFCSGKRAWGAGTHAGVVSVYEEIVAAPGAQKWRMGRKVESVLVPFPKIQALNPPFLKHSFILSRPFSMISSPMGLASSTFTMSDVILKVGSIR